MMKFLLKNRVRRSVSFTLLLVFITQIVFPTASLALTSGPSTPEVQSFEPISTSDMVDVSTGDFKYNIPLMDIEGYPINLAYNSGISTDQEASWVGLGWNLNVGAVNRSMRGLPDDFKGETIHKEMNTKANRTFGLNVAVDFELFGKESKKGSGAKKGKSFGLKPSVGVGVNYNNYNGFGVQYSVGMGISAGNAGKGSLNANLGLTSDAASGLDINPSLSFSVKTSKKDKADESLSHVSNASASAGGSFNSRAGLKQLTFGGSFSQSSERTSTNAQGKEVTTTSNGKAGSGSGCVNFGLQSYSPSMNWSMINNSVLLTVKFGAQLFGNDLNASIGGYYSSQKLIDNTADVESYGYMYSEVAQNNEHVMLDFNREKDGSYNRTTKNLPLTNFTYDVFNIAGQGIGGAFRPFRSDVGHVYDMSTSSQSDSYSLGADLSGGNLLKGGVDISVVDVDSKTGRWKKGNEAYDYFQFKGATNGNEYEPYYFKRVGEMNANPENTALYNSLMGDEAYGIRIQQGSSNDANNPSSNSNSPNIRSKPNIERYNYDGIQIPLVTNTNRVTKRQKRNQFVNTLTRKEAEIVGFQKDLYNSTSSGVDRITPPSAPMKAYSGASHHIAEISVVSPEGMRYYYGLPAYNIKNRECSFNISTATENAEGLVTYNAGDASLNNTRGTDNYYSMTETPAYAYSYLLTSVVSSDYADVNDNGPDDNDIGTYTKFHYIKASNGGSNYEWRMPVSSTPYSANYSENSKSNINDNMANFTYGEKELWYVDEIETKNYVAKFVLSDRKDAKGIVGSEGNLGGVSSKKIDKIVLYLKKDYIASLSSGPVAVPVKTVYFEYNYDLCQGIPNKTTGNPFSSPETSNAGGKLTLKKVYFTYGKSNRAIFNQYQFSYPTGSGNPVYHNKAYDRWGNYKPVGAGNNGVIDYSRTAIAANPEFPYVDQNKTNADIYTSAWTLNKIKLPSGGEITINYESDDYAFVQNVPVGQMFNVVGMAAAQPGNGFTLPGFSTLYQSLNTNNNYLIVDINNTTLNDDAEFVKRYLKDISEDNKRLFFKFLINLTNSSAPTPNFYEYVSGYADVEMSGGKGSGGIVRDGSGNPTGKAWVKLKEVPLKNKSAAPYCNPIAMTAIQYARLNHGNVVWGANYQPVDDVEEALKQLAQAAKSSLKTMITGFKNPNKALVDYNYCKDFVPAKSVVRLYNPDGKRLGGGSRVKSLAINDKWKDMTDATLFGQNSTTYEQAYTYETTDDGNVISSGVASYEPMIGSEENSMKQPFFLGKNKWALMAPDDRYYVEGPFGESFFPVPIVCYSKVKVKMKLPSNANNAANSTKNGYKIYEFYTAKDYPTITRHTPIMPKQFRSPLRSLIKIAQTDLVFASQGYAVITNDMHGKPRSESDYAEGKSETDAPVKSVRYFYKSKGGYHEPTQRGIYSDASYAGNELDNKCKVINKDGSVSNTLIGVDFDAIADFREAETETQSISSQNNIATFLVSVIPAVVPSIWPSIQYELTRFRSAVLTKVVNHYGVLERTETSQEGVSNASENIAFDAETGEVLISKTENSFSDPVYNVKYPAHWGYDLMGGAYKNTGIVMSASPWVNPGQLLIPGAEQYLRLGDEVLVSDGTTSVKAWLTYISTGGGNIAGFSDQNGNPCTLTSTANVLKVIRSGRRNLLSNEMAILTCLKYPIVTNNNVETLSISAGSQILDATGVEYADNWQIPLGLSNVGGCTCSATQLGTYDMLGLLQSLFNYDASGLNLSSNTINQFLNGAYSGAPAPGIQTTSTYLWKNPSWSCSALPICSFVSGFSSPSNHGFTQNLLNEIISVNSNQTPQYVVWNGPSQASLFTGNKIVGYFATNNATYNLEMDFTDPSFGSTQQNQLYSYAQNLRNGINKSANGCYFLLNVSPNQTDCNSNQIAYSLDVQINNATVASYPVKVSANFLNNKLITNCQSPNGPVSYVCGKLPGYRVNPFNIGIKGNWRVKSNYTYLTDRVQAPLVSNNTDIRKDGYYSNFTPLYTSNGLSDWILNPGTGANKWVNTVQTTKYNQFGVEVETKDALGRYSSAIYGYNESLPVAVASNAQLREVAYDGFEDYDYFNLVCNSEPHFAFRQAILLNYASRSSQHAHTGKFSIQVSNTSNASITTLVSPSQQQANTNIDYFNYQIADPDFIYPFYPVSSGTTNTNYLVTYWVKEAGTGNQALDYLNNALTITQGAGSAFSISNVKRSTVIDGWQRVEYNFTIPSAYSGPLRVKLVNSSTNANLKVYFDDIRIQPANSKMKSYVYHPVNFKYMAELDENNYATYYEYDDQGNLIRVKKETERGVMTLKESKTHYATP